MPDHAAQKKLAALPHSTSTTQAAGIRCGLMHLLTGALCLLCTAPALAEVVTMPLSGQELAAPTPTAEEFSASPMRAMFLTEEEWKRYCNRPNAFQSTMNALMGAPNGATRAVRDPAYLPVLPMLEQKPAPKTKPKRPMTKPATTTPTASTPRVTNPQVASSKVSAPQVASPTPPRIASPTAPAVPTVPGPYSEVASPTGPVSSSGAAGTPPSVPTPTSPSAPTVASPANSGSPSLAAQPTAQDGIMTTGRGVAADMARNNASTSGIAASSAAGSAAGAIAGGIARNGRNVLRGQADSLVVPPPGISLTPNNGSGALTAPTNPQ